MKVRKPLNILRRTSSITNSFVQAILPSVEPTEAEKSEALSILGMTPENMWCAYCGGPATDSDHLRPLVRNKRPTGYINEIRNLVPSCGPCNQSKGGADWRKWMQGDARGSPKSRLVSDYVARMKRLEAFEAWGKVKPLPLHELAGTDEWNKHWANHDALVAQMQEAQAQALKLRTNIRTALQAHVPPGSRVTFGSDAGGVEAYLEVRSGPNQSQTEAEKSIPNTVLESAGDATPMLIEAAHLCHVQAGGSLNGGDCNITGTVTPRSVLDQTRRRSVDALGRKLGARLERRSQALYYGRGGGVRVACTVSKRYPLRPGHPYWFSYYPQWDDFLSGSQEAHLVLGCADLPFAFALPHWLVRQSLNALNRSSGGHWQMNVTETGRREYALLLPGVSKTLALDPFAFDLDPLRR